jgi:hypothetical protein
MSKPNRFEQFGPREVRIMLDAAYRYHEAAAPGAGLERLAEQSGVSLTTTALAVITGSACFLSRFYAYFGLDENGVMDWAKAAKR